jgi:putative aldouronate transport system substrate-binding protein
MTQCRVSAIGICAVLLCFSVLGAFGRPQAEVSAAPKLPIIKALVSVSQIPAEKNVVAQEIGKRVGIDFQPIHVENNQFSDKLNTLIASGTLPDLVCQIDILRIRQMAEARMIVPLDDLLASDGKNVMQRLGPYFNPATYIGGKKYFVPGIQGYGQEALAIRKDWLDNLGMKMPTTLDEYYNVLKAFTQNDPNKNGKADTIGLGATMAFMATFNHVFGAYQIPFQRDVYLDGKVVPYFLHPNFMDAVNFYRRLYAEGLMEPDFATIPNMSMLEKLWAGVYGAYDGSPVGTTNNWIGRYKETPKPVFEYAMLKGPSGKSGTRRLIEGLSGTVINAASKYPKDAMRLLNLLLTPEGNELTYLGIRGTHWDRDLDGKIKYLPPYSDNLRMHRDEGGFIYYYVAMYPFGAQFESLTPVTRVGLKLTVDASLPDAVTVDTAPIAKEIGSVLSDLMKEAFAKLIVSNQPKEDAEKYVKRYYDAGGDKYIQQATEIYKREQGIK